MGLCAALGGRRGRRGKLGDHALLCRQDEKEQKARHGDEMASFREEEEREPAVSQSHGRATRA